MGKRQINRKDEDSNIRDIVYCQRRLSMGMHYFSPKLSVSNFKKDHFTLLPYYSRGVLFHHLHDIKLSVFKNKPL
jgi:hypothetical protein